MGAFEIYNFASPILSSVIFDPAISPALMFKSAYGINAYDVMTYPVLVKYLFGSAVKSILEWLIVVI